MARPRKNQAESASPPVIIEGRPNLETPGLLEIDRSDDNVIPFMGTNPVQSLDSRDTTAIDSVLAQFGITLV